MSESVSRAITLAFEPPLEASSISEAVSQLLLKLADGLSVEGIVPGHIKALLRDGDLYAILSCTRPGKVVLRASEQWNTATVKNLQLTIEVIVLTIAQDRVAALVESCWSVFLAIVEDLPN